MDYDSDSEYTFRRGSESEIAQGIVYYIKQDSRITLMVVRRNPGQWECLTYEDTLYEKQPDGWFAVKKGAFFDLRDPRKDRVMDAVERDYERYVNDLITVLE